MKDITRRRRRQPESWQQLIQREPRLLRVEESVLSAPPIRGPVNWWRFMLSIRRRVCSLLGEQLGEHRSDSPAGIAIAHLARVADDWAESEAAA